MARPKTPTGTTHHTIRTAKSKANLLKAGGRRTTINMPPETERQIADLIPDFGGDMPKGARKAVVVAAINALWRQWRGLPPA